MNISSSFQIFKLARAVTLVTKVLKHYTCFSGFMGNVPLGLKTYAPDDFKNINIQSIH